MLQLQQNMGYAFVNFIDPEDAKKFMVVMQVRSQLRALLVLPTIADGFEHFTKFQPRRECKNENKHVH